MKPATVDMLRAHLMVASFTAMGAEILACLAIFVLPVSPATLSTTPFRLLAIAVIVSGVVLVRQVAQAAFELAVRSRHVMPFQRGAIVPDGVSVAANCPRRELVILHLRFTGRLFVLIEH